MIVLAVILIALIALVALVYAFAEPDAKGKNGTLGDAGEWEYGDVWKEGTPGKTEPAEDIEYVEILRGDTGTGYDDSTLIDLVGYLGSKGVRATYDSFSLAAEVGAMKTYVLKVEAGKEEEATAYLKEKFKAPGPHRK